MSTAPSSIDTSRQPGPLAGCTPSASRSDGRHRLPHMDGGHGGRDAVRRRPCQRGASIDEGGAPVLDVRFYVRRKAHAWSVGVAARAVNESIFPRGSDPAMAMKPLLVTISRHEVDRHNDLVDDLISRPITDDGRRAIHESGERVSRIVSLASYRGQLCAALARDIETTDYLSDLGMRAGVYGLEAA